MLFKNKNKYFYIIIICTIFLSVFGCIMVYSASSYSALKNYNNKYFFLIKQIIGVVLGFVSMTFFYNFNHYRLKKYHLLLVFISIVLLLLVFIPKIGISNYGANRWINLFGVSFQPSELAKFSLVLFASSYASKNLDNMKTLKGILPIILVGGIFCVLVILEPNMSITMCLGLIMIFMLFISGMKFKHFLLILIPALILVPILIIIEPYRLKRLLAFLDPWASPKGEGFQLIQSLYSLGSGGLFGVGLFNSRQKYLFLPFSESDFIFSIIGEELGLIGGIFILLVYFVLVYSCVKVGLQSKSRYSCYLACGIGAVIIIQVILNIAVVTGSIPPTGLPLPLISAGSTSIVMFLSAIGIVLNISKKQEENEIDYKKTRYYLLIKDKKI